MPARVDPELAQMMERDPQAELEVTIVARDGLDELLRSLPSDIAIQREYHLIPSVTATARASTLQAVAEMPIVKSIEPVRPVHHC
jgi:hypothetical protein